MLKRVLYILLFFFSFQSHSQNTNLCGLWFGYNYTCATIDQWNKWNFYSIPVEIIYIEQAGQSVKALKITGDPCVPAGNITWEGNYITSPFSAMATVGGPNCPACSQFGIQITVKDYNHLQSVD